jgi:hypothetical protein
VLTRRHVHTYTVHSCTQYTVHTAQWQWRRPAVGWPGVLSSAKDPTDDPAELDVLF